MEQPRSDVGSMATTCDVFLQQVASCCVLAIVMSCSSNRVRMKFAQIYPPQTFVIKSVSVSVSVLTLTVISIDRWYAICHPLKFKSTSSRAKRAIVLIWLTSLLLGLPEAIVMNIRPNPELRVKTHYFTDCTFTWSVDNTRIYQLIIVLLLYVAPFAFMSVFYYQIARVLWNKNIPGSSEVNQRPIRTAVMKSSRNGAIRVTSTSSTANSNVKCQIRNRRKAAKMIIAVMVLFGLCYLPVHLINTLRYTTGLPQTHATTVASLISHWLCYANSAVNPIIYNFMSGKFRREFRRSFCFLCTSDELDTAKPTPAHAPKNDIIEAKKALETS